MAKLSLSHTRRAWWQSDEIHMLAVLVLAALFFYLGALSVRTFKEADQVDKPIISRDTIDISGKGTVKVTPDIAVFSAGLETVAKTVGAAQKENTEKMNAFLARATQLGIADADRKTTQYTIYPKYEDQTEGDDEKQVKVGDAVLQTVELKIRNLQNLGALMSALGEQGLNQVGSLVFTVDDEEAIKKRALSDAIRDARERASIVAQQSGMKLGKIVSFYESDSDSFPSDSYYAESMSVAADGERGATPLPQAGTQEITANVTLMFELK